MWITYGVCEKFSFSKIGNTLDFLGIGLYNRGEKKEKTGRKRVWQNKGT